MVTPLQGDWEGEAWVWSPLWKGAGMSRCKCGQPSEGGLWTGVERMVTPLWEDWEGDAWVNCDGGALGRAHNIQYGEWKARLASGPAVAPLPTCCATDSHRTHFLLALLFMPKTWWRQTPFYQPTHSWAHDLLDVNYYLYKVVHIFSLTWRKFCNGYASVQIFNNKFNNNSVCNILRRREIFTLK